MTDKPINSPPSILLTVPSKETASTLGYATAKEFERAAFGVMGLVGFCWAMLSIIRISIDCVRVATINGRAVPKWLIILFDMRIPQQYYGSSNPRLLDSLIFARHYWIEGLIPVLEPMIALFLLAGAIGCYRRYARTRWWMIAFATLTLVKIAISLLLTLVVQLNMPYYYYIDRMDVVIGTLEHSAGEAVFCIVLLWIMTRPFVADLFRKTDWL